MKVEGGKLVISVNMGGRLVLCRQYEKASNTKIFSCSPASYIPKLLNMPPKADSIEIAIQNALAAMDADLTLKGTDVAK
jgi:hypothetical protein